MESHLIPYRNMCGHVEAAKAAMKAVEGLDASQTEAGLYPDSHANDAGVVKQMTRPDASSFANFDVVKVLNYHLDLVADFDTSVMSGSVTYNLKTVVANAGIAVFDIRDIDVKSAKIVTGAKDVAGVVTATEWWITRKEAKLGQALVVRLPAGLPAETTIDVKVEYATSPSASAVQWLTPEQTVGKAHPYIFTQCQAIHARSLLPCMDTPGIKSTYTAALTVPAPLQALMSAILVDEKPVTTEVNGKPHNQWKFDQRIPIPIYLIAILVGNLEKRDLSHRCAVWSEPEVVDKAAWEFEDLEKIVATTESICGPYEWGRYDIAVLPGSFPYGGMESQMTFLTPSLIAGDRSLVNVLAHEAAQSYFLS
jgi:leukotriene-A4 hydrolase